MNGELQVVNREASNVNEETTNPKSEISTSEIRNMEVHHHPDLHHRKKRWKEYFLEFLMIFLAVTLGFFAENLREHISDSKKEKEFIKSLTDDLKKDTAEFPRVFTLQNRLLISMDSCLKIQPEQLNNIDEQDKFYPYFVFVYSWIETFSANDNAYTQLKNAGEFNLVHNQGVMDSIGLFYKFYERFVKGNTEYYTNYFYRLTDVASQMMKLPIPPVDENDPALTQIPHHIKIFTHTDDISVEQLYSWIRNLQGTLLLVIANEKIYLNRAENLINFLKDKYNLQ